MSPKLQAAIEAIKSGDRVGGQKILAQIIKAEPGKRAGLVVDGQSH